VSVRLDHGAGYTPTRSFHTQQKVGLSTMAVMVRHGAVAMTRRLDRAVCTSPERRSTVGMWGMRALTRVGDLFLEHLALRYAGTAQGQIDRVKNLSILIRPAFAMVLVVVAVWVTSYYHGHPRIGIDDANIFFSYADNRSTGQGFVYNKGGERVEGFSSILWVILCALAFRLGFHEQSLLVASVVLLILVQLLFLTVVRRESRARHVSSWPAEFLYMMLVFSAPAYVTWLSITPVDTCLWGSVVALAVFLVAYPPSRCLAKSVLVLTFLLMPLVRPEGMLLCPVLIALLGVRMYAEKRPSILRTMLVCFLGFSGVLVALTAFRLRYFGYPLPNTFYAKVSPSIEYNIQQGMDYLLRFVHSSTVVGVGVPIVMLCIAHGVAAAVQRILPPNGPNRSHSLFTFGPKQVLSAAALVLLLVPVITGGDHFGMFRFFQPAYPILCLAITLAAQRVVLLRPDVKARTKKRGIALILAAGCLLPLSLYWLWTCAHDDCWGSLRWQSPIKHEFQIAEVGISQGRQLKQFFAERPTLPSVGVVMAGGIKRTYPGDIVDLMGLNSTVMGHSKGMRKGPKNHAAFEASALYLLEPDIVLARLPAPGQTDNFYTFYLKDVFQDSRFQAEYSYGQLRSKSVNNALVWTTFFHKDFVRDLTLSGEWEFLEDENWLNNWCQ
jgi:arabinofuranosyltransferase